MESQFLLGRPISSLQHFLWEISFHDDIPRVFSDGIYGRETEQAVSEFQRQHNLPVTGKTDQDTWEAVVVRYEELMRLYGEPRPARIFPGGCISEGEHGKCMWTVQQMLNAVADRLDNIPHVEVNGVMNGGCKTCMETIQRCAGLEVTGELNTGTWNYLAEIYDTFVNIFSESCKKEVNLLE